MISKPECLIISAVVACVVGLITAGMTRGNKHQYKISAVVAITVFLIGLVYCLAIKKKENYDGSVGVGSPSSSNEANGCTQNITINQNCDKSKPQPAPIPIKKALSTKDVEKWIKSVNPDLTSQCKKCVVESVKNMWDGHVLELMAHKPMEAQKAVLDALLVFDCKKQCTVTPAELHPNLTEVKKWLSSVVPKMEAECLECVADQIVKLWTEAQFHEALKKHPAEQLTIIDAVYSVHCTDCKGTAKVPRDVLEKWLTVQLTGAKPGCYKCLLDNMARMWDEAQFNKIKKMDAKSRRQVIQSLISLNCLKECVYVPTGLKKGDVSMFVHSVLGEQGARCMDCLSEFILKNWTVENYARVKDLMPKDQQQRILHALITLECKNQCSDGHLDKKEVMEWVSSMLERNGDHPGSKCIDCVANQVLSSYNKADYSKLRAETTAEQVKFLHKLGEHACPHACSLSPPVACSVLPY